MGNQGQCCSTGRGCCTSGKVTGAALSREGGRDTVPGGLKVPGIAEMPEDTLPFKDSIAHDDDNNGHRKSRNNGNSTSSNNNNNNSSSSSNNDKMSKTDKGGREAALKGAIKKEYDDGSVYVGQMVDGLREGEGIWRTEAGQYDGQWREDLQHGRGSQTWQDGRAYDGNFENGKFSGYGRMVWQLKKGKLVYEGQYKDDMKHGTGTFTWADGRAYEGEWQNGKRHGTGVYTNLDGVRKTGMWKEDEFSGWLEKPGR